MKTENKQIIEVELTLTEIYYARNCVEYYLNTGFLNLNDSIKLSKLSQKLTKLLIDQL